MTGVLLDWAAQGDHTVHRYRRATAVVASSLVRYDRAVVEGPADEVRKLVPEAVPPGHRLLGRAELMAEVCHGDPAWELTPAWSWMTATAAAPPGEAAWLGRDAWPEVEDLLTLAFPDSYTWPGMNRVTRWAGLRDSAGRLVATAADGPSAETVGCLAGVAVHPEARGAGLARRICGFVTRELSAVHGRVGLMVDDWNTGAVALYESLGFTDRIALRAAIPVMPEPGVFT